MHFRHGDSRRVVPTSGDRGWQRGAPVFRNLEIVHSYAHTFRFIFSYPFPFIYIFFVQILLGG